MKFRALLMSFFATVFVGAFSQTLSTHAGASLTDKDGNIYIVSIMPDGRQWLMENLRTDIPASYCYGDSVQNCLKYGRLYTWKSAMEGCELLGKTWRLPTSEDWEKMVDHYGGIRNDDIGRDGKDAYRRLIHGGDSGFNILFAGTRDPSGSFRRIHAHGFFWTATESDSAHALFYNLGKGGQYVNRHTNGEKSRAISARCMSP